MQIINLFLSLFILLCLPCSEGQASKSSSQLVASHKSTSLAKEVSTPQKKAVHKKTKQAPRVKVLPAAGAGVQPARDQGQKAISALFLEVEQQQIAVLQAAKQNKWEQAYSLAKGSKYPSFTAKLVTLVQILGKQNNISAEEIREFVAANPWMLEVFRKEFEDMWDIGQTGDALKWFFRYPPASTQARTIFYNAQLQVSNTADEKKRVMQQIKSLWTANIFSSSVENYIRKEYAENFTQNELRAKANLLLWNNKHELLSPLLKYLSPGVSSQYKNYIKLAAHPEQLEELFKANNSRAKDDEFFRYIYIKHLLKMEQDQAALKLLMQTTHRGHFEKWWLLKRVAIKNAIREKQYKTALHLAQNHRLRAGSDFADAQWYSGFISFRMLKQPKVAIEYFRKFFEASQTANSKSQAAYWLALAFKESGERNRYEYWMKVASEYAGNFYGQLALLRLHPSHPSSQPDLFRNTSAITYHTPRRKISLETIRKMSVAAKVLFSAGYKQYAFTILKKMTEAQVDQGALNSIAAHYIKAQAYPLATTFAKYLVSSGHPLVKSSYPTHIKFGMRKNECNSSLYYAIMRQESDFDQKVVSAAGAVGLMQLMPATAKQCAIDLGLPHNAYIHSAEANSAKGCLYLDKLMRTFDGNYILTIASYNAGEKRVQKWINDFGDVRQYTSIDKIVDWIEMIPYNETKLYVKKIIENMVIYEVILSDSIRVTRQLQSFLMKNK